ncbi:MAG: hypothetical protein GX122_05940 [Candidatus Cloacimonetes bacterium]|nr:hypothetical protein [Candidatus Cloacimonadota bacterium]NLO11940.1 hypothetical protein [Candidatus Cloacimonadota bacterium]
MKGIIKFTLWIALATVLMANIGCAQSCSYSIIQHQLENNEIDEASGIAASHDTPGLLYTHNDSGGEPLVYVLNGLAMLAARLHLQDASNIDWEDIAVSPHPQTGNSCIWVGDIGDNKAKRNSVVVYRFEEPAITDTAIIITDYDRIHIQYDDGARDAEALFIDPLSGDICIISKREEAVGFYRVAYPYSLIQPNTAIKEATLPLTYVVAADISPDGEKILVKTYSDIYLYKRNPGKSIAKALTGKPSQVPYQLEPQGEAVTWDAEGKGYWTLSESAKGIPATLYHYHR